MSTETKPLKLMPHTLRKGANGRVFVEPGAESEFELPLAFQDMFTHLVAGASLSKLVDTLDVAKAGPRFRLIKKFLLFLDEHDMLADRDYIRLAESLKPEYRWPTSIIQTELLEIPLSKPMKKAASSRVVTAMIFGATVVLAAFSLFYTSAMGLIDFEATQEPTFIRPLILFLVSMSLARTFQALWAGVTSWVGGSRPAFEIVIEPLAIHLRQEQKGRAVKSLALLSNALSFFSLFGITAALSIFARQRFDIDILLLAGAFAFFTETSPYSRTSMTDLLRSLYARFEEKASETGKRERAIRRAHISACVAWVLMLGFFFALFTDKIVMYTVRALHLVRGGEKLAAFGLLAVIALFALSWLADLFGSVSYDGATIAEVRRLWRRQKESPLQSMQGLPPSAQDLERLPFLRQIPADVRKSLLLAAQVRVFKEGQAICHQNDRDRNLFVVLEGRLAVARTSTNVGSSRRKVVAWLDPGAVFGENAFFFGNPRSADIIGMDAGRVLVVPHTKEMNIVEGEKSDLLRARIWFLQALMQSQFFKALPADSLDGILNSGVEQRFTAGHKIIQEGEQADACYVIVQGRANVTQKTRSVGKLNAGDAFGEIAILFPGTLRTATIVAESDMITIRIDRDKFSKLLKAHLPLALEIERLGLRRLKQDQARN